MERRRLSRPRGCEKNASEGKGHGKGWKSEKGREKKGVVFCAWRSGKTAPRESGLEKGEFAIPRGEETGARTLSQGGRTGGEN